MNLLVVNGPNLNLLGTRETQIYGNVTFDAFFADLNTHTSVALRDCIAAIQIPVIEVHISNIAARESFRHESLLSPVCKGCIFGFGLDAYKLAIHAFEL